MSESIVAEVRERVTPREVVGTAAVAVVFYALGFDETALGILVGIVIGVPIVSAVFDRVGFGPTSAGLGFGTVAAGTGALTVLNGDSSPWLGVVLLGFGCWIVLDTLYEYCHGEPTASGSEVGDEEPSMAEMQALGTHGRWVLEALREADRPLTAEEIRERTGLTPEELADVVEIVGDNGTVESAGNGYVIDESAMGLSGFVRRVGGRLLRPVRLFRPSG